MTWLYDSAYANGQLYVHAGFVLSLRNGEPRNSADDVRGWRAACECGWRGGREYLAADHPHQNDEIPPEVDGSTTGDGCFGEWMNHLHQIIPELPIHDLAITAHKTRDQLTVAVAEARSKGISWQVIAAAAGISRQAAHERWAKSSTAPPPESRAARGLRRIKAGKRSLTLSAPATPSHPSTVVAQFDRQTANLLAQLTLEEADAVDDAGRHEDAQRLRDVHHQLAGALRTPTEADAAGESTSSPFHPVNIAERTTAAVLDNTARRFGGVHLALKALATATTTERHRHGIDGELDVIRAIYGFLEQYSDAAADTCLWPESSQLATENHSARSRPRPEPVADHHGPVRPPKRHPAPSQPGTALPA